MKHDRLIQKFTWEIILKNKDNVPSLTPRCMIKLLCFRPCGTGIVQVQRPMEKPETDGGVPGNSIYNRGGAANRGKIEDTINNVRKLATWKGELFMSYTKGIQ